MKICLLSYRGNPYCGGQGIYLMYIARELVKLGHEVHAIVGPPYPHEMENVVLHRISNHNYFNIRKDFIKAHKPFATLQPFNFYEFFFSKLGVFPEIETFMRVFSYTWRETALITNGEKHFYETAFFLVDPSIFDIFTFVFIGGDPGIVFENANAIVITEAMAKKYFGDENPLGKSLTVTNLGRRFVS